jgi:hypothetical protein
LGSVGGSAFVENVLDRIDVCNVPVGIIEKIVVSLILLESIAVKLVVEAPSLSQISSKDLHLTVLGTFTVKTTGLVFSVTRNGPSQMSSSFEEPRFLGKKSWWISTRSFTSIGS